MPRTGSLTPPIPSPPLANPQHARSHHTSPPASPQPTHRPQTPLENDQDPFLAQVARIPLTEEDRQEGYDVELLNARPRGRYSSDLAPAAGASDADHDSLLGAGALGEKYGAGAGGGGLGGSGAPLPPRAGLGSGSHGALVPGGGGGYGSPGKEFGLDSNGGYSGTTAQSGARERKPWFLRPLPLVALVGFIVACALAIGLGVGLSLKHSNTTASTSRSSGNSTVSGSGSRSGSRTSTRTRTMTTGTVVPSSLYSSYTSLHPQTDDSTTASLGWTSTVGATATETTTLPSALTSVPSPASGTTLATSGNLPIPAASATTISGSITISALTATLRARAPRQTMRFEG
ncbi:uncharacterized protein RHTO_03415 [Rhodotorula toruloides NP11]|uniref:Uncharacterized protein n=1 Tax=Rhodotorula toruloides (strain NP11) TaxID=1130832 RepID=M7WQZ0_RHOT1|nr:uncharacterized protein RHTO_03415 [Rhodotorula toruloides NP11]EMS20496.1 hypothetical protein RHTO_03415 [Rhodotorula toruloides NP11]